MEVGTRLRQIRKSQGRTLEYVSKVTGLSQPFISQLENDQKSPSLESLEKLCNAYEITFAEFFTLQNPTEFVRLQQAISTLTPTQKDLLVRFLDQLRNNT